MHFDGLARLGKALGGEGRLEPVSVARLSSVRMDAHEDTPRIQVLSVSDTGRRRRRTDDEKFRIVEESHHDGVTLADVARRHEISGSMHYDWRYRHKLGLFGASIPFVRLVPMDSHTHAAGALSSTTPPPPVKTTDLCERYRCHDPRRLRHGGHSAVAQWPGCPQMIAFPAGAKVWIAGGVTDMRCGMNSLALKVQQGLGRNPHGGEIFCFRGRRGDHVSYCTSFFRIRAGSWTCL
jgi:transposase